MPRVSVIIPAYNAEKYLRSCLISLREQSFRDFEIVVVDDGSSDKTFEVASSYADRVIRTPHNLGVGEARNLGASRARGEIFVFTDADVVVPPHWLKRLVQNIDKGFKCVGGPYQGCLGDSFIEKFAYLELVYRRRNFGEFVNTTVANNFALTREVFFELGGFPDRYRCEDLRLSFKISRKYPIFWDRENGVYHHFKPSLKEYLKQQFYFARDTVLSYYEIPAMILTSTHQGSLIYIETVFTFLFLATLIFFSKLALVFAGLILILNLHFLSFLKRKDLSFFRSLFIVLIRDLICLLGVARGGILCFEEFLRGLFKKR